MSSLAYYIAQVYDNKEVHPEGLSESQIFGTPVSAPFLDSVRTNRILIYPGSFNPPHRGHLQLLRHTFISGVHDLNVIAAIITPRSDESVMRKCASAGKTFRFGLEERSLLWEQDLAFPSWAWVYRDKTRNFTEFLGRLKQVTLEGGFKIEFAMLYGPEIASPENPPTGAYGCDIIILGDAGRQASYQRSNGRLRNFVSCTKWTRVRVDKDLLESHARTKANRAILRMKNVCQDDAQSMDEDGQAFVERTTSATVARAIKDLERVLYCRHITEGRTITLRFVKSKSTARKAQWIRKISSTNVRNAMRGQKERRLKNSLEEMALSAELLWHQKTIWVDLAKRGLNDRISFPTSCLEDAGDIASVDCHTSSSTDSHITDIPFHADEEDMDVDMADEDIRGEEAEENAMDDLEEDQGEAKDKVSADRLVVDESEDVQLAGEKPMVTNPHVNDPVETELVDKKDDPMEDGPTDEKPRDEKPADDQPVQESSMADMNNVNDEKEEHEAANSQATDEKSKCTKKPIAEGGNTEQPAPVEEDAGCSRDRA